MVISKNVKSREKGFTLVEMAIVLIVFGIVITILTSALAYYNAQKTKTHTLKALESSKAALSEFWIVYGRYPCPADPDLAPSHPDYGYEAAPCGTTAGSSDSWNIQAGTAAETATAISHDASDPRSGSDLLFFGSIPFKTLEEANIQNDFFSPGATVDGWGRKITYAVSGLLTDTATYRDDYGAFDIHDEFEESILNEPGTAHAVLVSHGSEDAKGAYTVEGKLVDFCTNSVTIPPGETEPPKAPPGRDRDQTENCDHNDEFFLSGLRSSQSGRFNDDFVKFIILRDSELWNYTSDLDPTPAQPNSGDEIKRMTNTNPGRIGIGTNEPDEQVHVLGDIKATEVMADEFCDTGGADCFTADVIAGDLPTMKCPDGQAVTKIGRNADGDPIRVHCEVVFATPATGNCPPGEYMYGVSNIRGVLCQPL